MDNIKKLKIANWNANGINNKLHELEEFLYRHRIDVCSISESKLSNKSKNINFINYNCYRKDRISSHNGGGVAIMINKKFNSTEKCVGETSLNSLNNIEAIAVTLLNITFVAAYMPLQKSLIIDEISKILAISSNVVVGGDFNAKNPAWGNADYNKSGKTLLNYMLNINFNNNCQIDFPDEPTYFSTNSRNDSVLDNFITKKVALNKPLTINELSSDHLPVIAHIKTKYINDCDTVHKKNYRQTNWEKYRKLLNLNWTLIKDFDCNNEIDNTIEELFNTMKLSLEKATPK